MKKTLFTIIVLGFTSSTLMANGAALYNKCKACHGANGEKVALGTSKILSNMTKQELIDAMQGYKDGSYGREKKALMIGQVRSLSSADIDAIATFIAK